ncbi:MAG: EAL domain-containing protein [Sphingomonadaceae bacterium]
MTMPDLSTAKILIVDDQPMNIAALNHILAKAGYQCVTSTTDAREVAELHRTHHYDLIVLDLHMPHLSGFEVLEQLKEVDREAYLPVLVVTAAPEHKLQALEAGARDFVCKPYDVPEVLTRIRNMLEVRLLYNLSREYGRRMAQYDALTGLPNRQLFMRTLEGALQASGSRLCAVLLADIDGFQRLNDTLGHAAGDEVLRQFAERLSHCVPVGCAVGRLGNDEFAVLLNAPEGLHQVTQLAEQIRAAVALPLQLQQGGGEVRLSTSIGIAVHPGDSKDAATLVKYADTALSQVKRDGSDHYRFFTDAMNAATLQRFELERALRQACEQGEFEMHYQPKVRLSTGRMVGAEALLRWNRPGHGQVSPLEFVPLLEETGLIVPVGAWIFDSVCAQLAQWAALGAEHIQVAVNVASRQFADPDLERYVAEALQRHGVDPSMLALEVTESALMHDTERTVATLARLRTLGLSIAIDDFGTGYSSLAYLKRFPVDLLKIDIAFIRELTHNPEDAALVDAIIAMAHSLRLDVIAEGVETEAQLAYLIRHRCDLIQGYFFSRPVAAAQFGQMLRDDIRLALPAALAAPVRTLLIVDDEPNVLSALTRLLRQDGYLILTASCASEAFVLLAQHPVHLILCDQRMAEMSGTELLDKVKDMYPDTFRIILSGYTDLKTVMDAINRGSLYRFYTKPWDNQVLRENIRAAFRHYWQLYGLAPGEQAT